MRHCDVLEAGQEHGQRCDNGTTHKANAACDGGLDRVSVGVRKVELVLKGEWRERERRGRGRKACISNKTADMNK